jgi:hypothetical protein
MRILIWVFDVVAVCRILQANQPTVLHTRRAPQSQIQAKKVPLETKSDIHEGCTHSVSLYQFCFCDHWHVPDIHLKLTGR